MQMQVLHDDQILKGLYIIAILATISVLGCGDSPVYDESIATPIEQSRDPNAEIGFQAADVLVNIGEPVVPELTKATNHKHHHIRANATIALQLFRRPISDQP